MAETYLDTAEYAEVSAAVAAASAEDTLYVPADDVIWNSALAITKGINLIGAGIGQTNIRNNGTSYLITYNPSDYTANNAFRLSGFTFDAYNHYILELGEAWKDGPFTLQTKVRIDHNRFTNSGTGTDLKGQAIWNHGDLYGVVDNNTFDGLGYPIAHSTGSDNDTWWANSPQNIFTLGSAYYMYFEDNTITLTAYNGSSNLLTDGEYGIRYVFRYNDIVNVTDSYSLLELHGEQSTPMPSCFGAEVYGNDITHSGYQLCLFKQRSGQTRVFLNNATGTTSPWINAYNSTACICPANYAAVKNIHNSYWWGNRRNLSGVIFDDYGVNGTLDCNGLEDIPQMGRDVFSDSSTPGITMGALGDIPGSATAKQGYWATTQSTSDLTGMVGCNPATPISGTLYVYDAVDGWEAEYTPYTYPHPLRIEQDLNAVASDSMEVSDNTLYSYTSPPSFGSPSRFTRANY